MADAWAHLMAVIGWREAVNALKAKGGQTYHTSPTPDSAGYYLSPTLITGVAPEETLEDELGIDLLGQRLRGGFPEAQRPGNTHARSRQPRREGRASAGGKRHRALEKGGPGNEKLQRPHSHRVPLTGRRAKVDKSPQKIDEHRMMNIKMNVE